MAVLARNEENLKQLCQTIRTSAQSGSTPVVEAFPTDTSPESLSRTFKAIASHQAFQGLKLRLAIYHVKHSSKEPFLDTKPEDFSKSLHTYTTGAFAFAQESVRLMYAQNGGQTLLADTQGAKKGTVIFTVRSSS